MKPEPTLRIKAIILVVAIVLIVLSQWAGWHVFGWAVCQWAVCTP